MKFKDIMLIMLIVVVIGMGGYIAYDKLFNTEENSSVIENNNAVDNSVTENPTDDVLMDETQIERYRNYDGSYVSVKVVDDVELDILGNVYYYHKDNKEDKKTLLLKNVIDIVSFSSPDELANFCYMLDKNGDVYRFKMNENNEKIEKVEISNVSRLLEVRWARDESVAMGGSWALVAVTNDGKYVEIAYGSV